MTLLAQLQKTKKKTKRIRTVRYHIMITCMTRNLDAKTTLLERPVVEKTPVKTTKITIRIKMMKRITIT